MPDFLLQNAQLSDVWNENIPLNMHTSMQHITAFEVDIFLILLVRSSYKATLMFIWSLVSGLLINLIFTLLARST